MTQKTIIITGANAGIGKAASIQLAALAHRLIMACRNAERGEGARQEVIAAAGSDAVELMIVDMSLQSSIRDFAAKFLEKHDTLDVLIHNAADFDVTQKERRITAEGVESIWATNHVGPVLLTDLLLGALKRSEQGRIITISSKGLIVFPFLKVNLDDPEFERRKFNVSKAYYQSKLAQVMYTYWLAEQLRDAPVTANCIRVTNVKIDIETRYPNASKLSKWMYSMKSRSSISPEKMAETYTYLATSPEVATTTGGYFDDPTHPVGSSKYSRDQANIAAVMALTQRYLQD